MSIDQKPGNSFYHPSKEVKKRARIKDYDKLYQESIKDREGFWAREAEELELGHTVARSLALYAGESPVREFRSRPGSAEQAARQ